VVFVQMPLSEIVGDPQILQGRLGRLLVITVDLHARLSLPLAEDTSARPP
jgi:hypothetical protein